MARYESLKKQIDYERLEPEQEVCKEKANERLYLNAKKNEMRL